jgi:hypothetical protein
MRAFVHPASLRAVCWANREGLETIGEVHPGADTRTSPPARIRCIRWDATSTVRNIPHTPNRRGSMGKGIDGLTVKVDEIRTESEE